MRALVTQVTFQHVYAGVLLGDCKPVVWSAGAGDIGGLSTFESRCGRELWGAACLAAWSGTSLSFRSGPDKPPASLHTVLSCLPALSRFYIPPAAVISIKATKH